MNNEQLKTIAKEYGTPAYVYNAEQIVININNLKKGVGNKPKIYYSVKANPNEHIIRIIGEYVDGVEISSIGEFILAQRAGINPTKMMFVGPGKKENELKIAISNNIGIIVVESIQELDIINQLAFCKKVTIALRINPKINIAGSRLNMAGRTTQFGIDEKEAFFILKNKKYKNLAIEGIHFYFGTQQLDGEVLNKLFLHAIEIFNQATSIAPLKFVDFGGGFGVPYYENEHPFKFQLLEEWKNAINSIMFSNYDVYIESGRYLVANCGYFLTQVLYTKKINGTKYAITDGGMNNHFALASIGRVLKRDFPVTVLNNESSSEYISIVGPLCTPVDVIANNVELPIIRPKDILAIKNSGAYGYTYSPQLFLSHPTPVEVLIDLNNNVRIIKEVIVVNN